MDVLVLIAIIILIIWVLGAFTIGGLINLLLVIAIVIIVIRVLQGRKVLSA